MKKWMIAAAVLAALVIAGAFLLRLFLTGQILDGDGMENPYAVSEPGETPEIPDTAELVSFHWYQSAMSYGNCFIFTIDTVGQDTPEPRLYCRYMDWETAECIEVGDEGDSEACPPVPLERWAELSDFLRKAELPAYCKPNPDLMDATDSRINIVWRDGDERFTGNYNGLVADELLSLLQDIAEEVYLAAGEEAKAE